MFQDHDQTKGSGQFHCRNLHTVVLCRTPSSTLGGVCWREVYIEAATVHPQSCEKCEDLRIQFLWTKHLLIVIA